MCVTVGECVCVCVCVFDGLSVCVCVWCLVLVCTEDLATAEREREDMSWTCFRHLKSSSFTDEGYQQL